MIEEKLKEKLKEKLFTLFIDGWGDNKQKHLTIGIRFWTKRVGIETRLFDDLDYIEGGDGKSLFIKTQKCILEQYGK